MNDRDAIRAALDQLNLFDGDPAVATTPRWAVHNIIAHPLLVLWPRFGVWLHDWTIPEDDGVSPVSAAKAILAAALATPHPAQEQQT